MAQTRALFLALIMATMLAMPLGVSAYDSGGIEASETQVAMIPSTGLNVGDSVTFYLTLTNTQQNEALNVGYAFYKNQYSSENKFVENVIDIQGDSSQTVDATWDGLLESDDKVWITFEYPRNSGNEVSFFIEFEVTGLPNLRVIQTELTPSSMIHAGDTIQLSSLVKNTGSEPAISSQLEVNLPGNLANQYLQTKSLNASEETWVNTTFTAPQTGSYSIYVTPDFNDDVLEASEQGKSVEVNLIVEPRMDLYHIGDLTVSPDTGSSDGPWTVDGTIGRIGESGTTDVTMWLEINHDSGMLATQPFTVSVLGPSTSQQAWSTSFDDNLVGALAPGSYQITAVIDPFNDGAFTQEDTSNDRLTSTFIILQAPDVLVDSIALPSSSIVQAGEKVTWGVSITNLGGETVTGNLEYTFEGVTATSTIISLDAGESFYWEAELNTASGSHTAQFTAEWIPSLGTTDRDLSNNVATNSITVESGLVLNWAGSSLRILDEGANPVDLPLVEGQQYTFAINLTSQELGELDIYCEDAAQNTNLATINVNVSTIGQKVSIECDFTASAPSTTIQLVPSDPAVTNTYIRKLTTISTTNNDADGEQSGMGTAALIGIGVAILIAIFAAAIWLTRETDEEVERDIFDYCPACDGELEGDENRCPHCSFNLSKARKQFHACHACGESVPDLMDNCPYCGTEQDVASFFERRERRTKKPVVVQEIALPEDDEDTIVSGTENFAETVKEFGYDEDQLEDDWDENFATAEAQIAEIEQMYEEELDTEGLTPEEIEELESQVTTRLKSLREMSDGSVNLDDMLAAKGELIAHKDDDSELSASDAEIRGRLYEITGEEGVMPGDEVHIGMGLSDSSIAGNEIEEVSSDFTVEDDEQPLNVIEEADELVPARQKPKRRQAIKKTAECGACGAEIPVMATQCSVCGAEFE
ncbi:MAG: CARDB domain-containing protein [Candidatus Thermoplasmatota archaeon]|nr:CARDB domain-containing protein [Candidatus Thermoplasmatota archaeon]